jgi:hypothetical protein
MVHTIVGSCKFGQPFKFASLKVGATLQATPVGQQMSLGCGTSAGVRLQTLSDVLGSISLLVLFGKKGTCVSLGHTVG